MSSWKSPLLKIHEAQGPSFRSPSCSLSRKGPRLVYTFRPALLQRAPGFRCRSQAGGWEGTCDLLLLPVAPVYPQSQQKCQARKEELGVLSPGTEADPSALPCYWSMRTRQELRLTSGIHLRLGWRKGNWFLLGEHSPILQSWGGQGVRRSQTPRKTYNPKLNPTKKKHKMTKVAGKWRQPRVLRELRYKTIIFLTYLFP